MLIGKKHRVYFDDGEKVSWREGNLTGVEYDGMWIDNIHYIPLKRVIRMEVLR